MNVLSEDKESYINIEILDTEFIRYPSVKAFVTVSDRGFNGAYDGIWLELDMFHDFITQLGQCEKTRHGNAVLTSINPEDFELVIENCDGFGHFLLRYMLSAVCYSSRNKLIKTVKGVFDLDSEFFAQIVFEFTELERNIRSFETRF